MNLPDNGDPERPEKRADPLKKAGDPLGKPDNDAEPTSEKIPPEKKEGEEEPDTFEKVFEHGKHMGF